MSSAAIRFCKALAAETADAKTGSWRMLDTIAKRMGITFEEAEKIAGDCVARQWVDHQVHSVRLREEGRVVAKK